MIELTDDHYNTHNPARSYQFLPPDEAHANLYRFEFHYTPKYGSWFNMTKIELEVFNAQYLDRRVAHVAPLRSEVAAW